MHRPGNFRFGHVEETTDVSRGRSTRADSDKIWREGETVGVCHDLEGLRDGVGIVERLAHALFGGVVGVRCVVE
jgi:hypothetical protein